MARIVLSDADQACVRAMIASEPLRDGQGDGGLVLHRLAQLISCDAIGVAMAGNSAPAPQIPHRPDVSAATPDLCPSGRGDGARRSVGVPLMQRGADVAPPALAVLSVDVRDGPDRLVRLWLVRRSSTFSDRDRAVLRLVQPAVERALRHLSASRLALSLTCQERRVLEHVASGLGNAEIAAALSVELCTVRKHLEHAYRKLGVTNRLAAVMAVESPSPAGRGAGLA